MEIKVFSSHSTNPYVNLAYENALLEVIPAETHWLFVYKNKPSIVLGRFQNPWIECDFEKIRDDNVHLVRRQSGGGTVYHDENNINYCFLHGTRDHFKERNHEIVISALRGVGVDAHVTDRSDIKVFDGVEKKISGSAFKQKKDRSFHHGTLLVNSDLKILNRYLRSKNAKAESKATKSNPSVVANLVEFNREITLESIFGALKDSFYSFYEPSLLNEKFISVENFINIDQDYLEKIQSKSWILFETPYFKIEKSVDGVHFVLESKKGKILNIEIMSSQLDSYTGSLLERFLTGKPLELETMTLVNEEFLRFVDSDDLDLKKIIDALKGLSVFN